MCAASHTQQVKCLREQNNSRCDHVKEKSNKTIDRQCNCNPHFPNVHEIRKPDFLLKHEQLLRNHEEYRYTKTDSKAASQNKLEKETKLSLETDSEGHKKITLPNLMNSAQKRRDRGISIQFISGF